MDEVGGVWTQAGDDHLGCLGVSGVVRRRRRSGRVGAVDADVDSVAADDAGHSGRSGVVVVAAAIWRSPLDHDRCRVDHVRSDPPRLAGNYDNIQHP